MKLGVRSAALAALVSSVLVLAACGGSSGDDTAGAGGSKGNASAGSGASSGPACKPAPAGTNVQLTYSSWVPGAKKVINLWNKQNPDIQVKYREVPSGQSGTYQRYLSEVKANRTADLGFVEYDALPTFRVQGALQNIGNCPGVKEAQSKFVPWAWQQASFGEKGAAYAIPQDVGPMAYFYRKDLFDKHGLKPATTWPEFLELAKKVKAQGGRAVDISAYAGEGFFAGLAWQAGASWYKREGDQWKVSVATDPATQRLADYWQQIIDGDLAAKYSLLGQEYNKALNGDRLWGVIGGAWMAAYLKAVSPKTSGDWRVAELPQWTAGAGSSGNWGGATLVVFKDSKYPAEAAKFALWLTTDPEAQKLNVTNGGILPATTDPLNTVPALQEGTPYLGGQKQWTLFTKASTGVPTNWQWGPAELHVQSVVQDGLQAALGKRGKLADVFKNVQTKSIASMKSSGIPVGE